MNPHPLFIRVALATLVLGSIGAAEKEKRADVSDYPFWNAPKRGHVAPFVPGLNAVLDLTDAQKQQISAARDEMQADAAVQAARSISKSDPSVTADERDKARAVVEAAAAQMHGKVSAVLTVEQKAMIENINGAYAEAAKQIGATYQEKVGAVKVGPEERRRMQQSQREEVDALFRSRLDEMLTPEQKILMADAARWEQQKGARPKKQPEPKQSA